MFGSNIGFYVYLQCNKSKKSKFSFIMPNATVKWGNGRGRPEEAALFINCSYCIKRDVL